MFFMRQGWGFTSCTDRHQPMRPVFNLKIDEFSKGSLVNTTIGKWRD